MRIHFVGVCGTFMGGLARLARDLGHETAGSDRAFYEPMASQLADAGIECCTGYQASCSERPADLYVIGNVARRGMPLVESILAEGRPFCSAPAFAARNLLAGRKVAAVAGTHGKTTVSSMLVRILSEQGLQPSYLLGGVHADSGASAQLGAGEHFVIEADEYDSAFFDKRPKFAHYFASAAIINNIEFDHADIYRDLDEIRLQFSRLGRCVLPGGTLIANGACASSVSAAQCASEWCSIESFGTKQGWHFGSDSTLIGPKGEIAQAARLPAGAHNRSNALAAIAAASALGADPAAALAALDGFELPARRLQEVARGGGVILIDDFAHHPTAIAATLQALRELHPDCRIVALLEIGSNTMRSGHWQDRLAASLSGADRAFAYGKGLDWSLAEALGAQGQAFGDADELAQTALAELKPGDAAITLSNGDFGGIRKGLASAVAARGAPDAAASQAEGS